MPDILDFIKELQSWFDIKTRMTTSTEAQLKTLQNHLKLKKHRYRPFSLLQPSEMASSNSSWLNRKERRNRSINNGYVG